jgi:hypothetical protein
MTGTRITTPVTTDEAIRLLMAVPGEHRITDPELARSVLNALRAARGRRRLPAGPLGSGKLTSPDGTVFFWTRNPDYVHASLKDIDAATR